MPKLQSQAARGVGKVRVAGVPQGRPLVSWRTAMLHCAVRAVQGAATGTDATTAAVEAMTASGSAFIDEILGSDLLGAGVLGECIPWLAC